MQAPYQWQALTDWMVGSLGWDREQVSRTQQPFMKRTQLELYHEGNCRRAALGNRHL